MKDWKLIEKFRGLSRKRKINGQWKVVDTRWEA